MINALGGTGSVQGGTGCWFLGILGQYGTVLLDTWWYWVSIGWYWLIYDCTGSVEASTGQYLVVLGQQKAELGQFKAVRTGRKYLGVRLKKSEIEQF